MPLLFEAKAEDLFDVVVYISASEKVRKERAMEKGFMQSDIKKRAKFLIDEKVKKRKSDYVVINNGSRKNLYKQIETLYQNFYM